MIPIQQLWRHLIPPPQLVPGAIRNPDFIFPKGRGFKMASLNITSLLKHIHELRIVLDGQPVDILAINETRLDGSISDQDVKNCGL